ncbi:hypothetical protein RP20_CCG026894 [Aedes albopictus]|nr:hypothetical protein RP20_CCG026894 [Aedes albopictus]
MVKTAHTTVVTVPRRGKKERKKEGRTLRHHNRAALHCRPVRIDLFATLVVRSWTNYVANSDDEDNYHDNEDEGDRRPRSSMNNGSAFALEVARKTV